MFNVSPNLNQVVDGGNNQFIVLRWLTRKYKITAIPVSAFYGFDSRKEIDFLVRFCFAKDEKTLNQIHHITNQINLFE